MKNILLVDDSALLRRVISDIIHTDGRFQVKDIARDGLEGLDKLLKNGSGYDAVILDINMPKMNGLELLAEIGREKIKVPVIMVSTLVKEGAAETIKALELGAFDFVLKPDNYAKVREEDFKNNLIKSLEAAVKLPVAKGSADSQPERVVGAKSYIYPKKLIYPQRTGAGNGRVLVALACSTGGPKALQAVIPKLPNKIGGGMIIVQHMPEGFTKSLADRLQDSSVISIKEANDGDMVADNQVYVAKGGYQLRVKEQSGESFISLEKDPPRGGLRPCADIMYESLVGSSYDKIVCVVLTGMGADATAGIRQLKETNNVYVIAQDEPTCTVYGMPRMVAEAGLADEVLPLDQIADAIVKATGVH
ncbi:MAG: chemotaxis-specific protein-glutamate methyltransferase CheB [Catonella sp.]|uniref:chemotaxis-specific protein-glutamate methyltransferase CheB n=1 Tax=Catonella sp. TaxID=2382125 RepID=UPI003FA0F21E